MSIHTSYSRLLSMAPKVIVTDSEVSIRDNLLGRILRCFFSSRNVLVASPAKQVTIKERRWWLFTTTYVLDFSEIDYLDYDAAEYTTSIGFNFRSFQSQDSLERFTVALVTKDEGYYELCNYVGEGSVENGWYGVIMGGDNMLDLAGTQQQDSRNFVNLLCDRIGIQIGKSYDLSSNMDTIVCPSCSREVAAHSHRCLYCGAAV